MKSEEALETFRTYLAAQNLEIRALNPKVGIAAFTSLYRNERVAGCDFENDGDMLLYQWGIYGLPDNRFFILDITRQLLLGVGEDEDIWQLSLTWKFEVSDELRNLGSASEWCQSPEQLTDFELHIKESASYQLLDQKIAVAVDLTYSCAG